MLNHLATVRMTTSLSSQLFADTAKLRSARQLTEQRLDMLRLHPTTDARTVCSIGIAADALDAGDYEHPAVVRCFEAFNQRCGR